MSGAVAVNSPEGSMSTLGTTCSLVGCAVLVVGGVVSSSVATVRDDIILPCFNE